MRLLSSLRSSNSSVVQVQKIHYVIVVVVVSVVSVVDSLHELIVDSIGTACFEVVVFFATVLIVWLQQHQFSFAAAAAFASAAAFAFLRLDDGPHELARRRFSCTSDRSICCAVASLSPSM